MTNTVTVACLCADPATHPDGDTITFFEKLDFRQMATAQWAISWAKTEGHGEISEIFGMLSEFYLLHCIERWTVLGEKREPLALTKENVRERLLSRPLVALEVADVADNLYAADVILPLVQRVSRSFGTSPTNGSTSPPSPTGQNGKRSKRSSTTTTPMAATAPTPG